jgi:cysteinyl-tRNA synthetase
MAKSTGNLYVLDDLGDRGIAPLAFRYFSLQAHYRQQQTFTDEAIESAATGYERLVNHAAELREADGELRADELEPLRERFWDAVRDDLNAPRAVAVTWEAVRSESLNPAERWALLSEFDAFLGLDLQNATPRSQTTDSDPRIDGLLAEREAARARRDFAESDRIRDLLAEEGISIEDTPDGPRWRRG